MCVASSRPGPHRDTFYRVAHGSMQTPDTHSLKQHSPLVWQCDPGPLQVVPPVHVGVAPEQIFVAQSAPVMHVEPTGAGACVQTLRPFGPTTHGPLLQQSVSAPHSAPGARHGPGPGSQRAPPVPDGVHKWLQHSCVSHSSPVPLHEPLPRHVPLPASVDPQFPEQQSSGDVHGLSSFAQSAPPHALL